MCQFIIENQGIQQFLVYHLKSCEEVDKASYDLIHDKKVPGILPTFLSRTNWEEDVKISIKFNISSRITMKEYFKNGATRKELLPMLRLLAETIQTCRQYMLDVNCIFLDAQYIYVNTETKEPELIYLPVIKGEEQVDIAESLKHIVLQLPYAPCENASYISELIQFLEKKQIVTFDGFFELLNEMMKEVKERNCLFREGKLRIPVMNLFQSGQPEPAQEGWTGPKEKETIDNANAVSDTKEKESTLVPCQKAYLKRLKTGEKVHINRRLFKIGKERDFVDYCITDNSAISRSHAHIVIENEEYYIVDMHSKNHTFVNGRLIPEMQKVKLVHASTIQLADEVFEFYLKT